MGPNRPTRRAFTSPAIERAIDRVQRQLGSGGTAGKLGAMFVNCFPNTLDTTVEYDEHGPDTFVITGDIPAMWLRDSTAQLWPYLRFIREDARLGRLIAGAIRRQTRCVLIDPYANAFNKELVPSASWSKDETEMRLGVHERKWEVDSPCAAIRLAYGYWRATGDPSPFDESWRRASKLIVATMRAQQRKAGRGPYHFQRHTDWSPDSVPGHGWGNPIRPVGLIVSMFRPSDDATIFPFLVPSNMLAVVSLRQLARMHERLFADTAFAADCRALAAEVAAALRAHALVRHKRRGLVWAYEVDGYGSALVMDDANAPNLLSLPYFGCCAAADPVYRRTRALVLSDDNPWFQRGRAAEGLGSPHTGEGRIWPIGIAMRALTSNDEAEILHCLRMLAATDAGTLFMHEGFDKDDPATFSRPWFAWANSLFGELVLKLADERPALLRRL
ncbi:MAG TPA: glycoside hydrolase family 125 protein [Allosphingosinicella sp.]|nr:glycoside hydrolase family 125 protein [Allosphingosinicella sp.]